MRPLKVSYMIKLNDEFESKESRIFLFSCIEKGGKF